jgi:tight adherence protein C
VLAEVEHRLRRGQRLADALSAFTEELGHPATAFVDALATADRYGLPLGPVLDRLADDIRGERRRRAERHARTLPVRLSFPLVVCTLPSFVLLAIVPALLGAVSTLRGTAP